MKAALHALRTRTGAALASCQAALEKAQGDLVQAERYLHCAEVWRQLGDILTSTRKRPVVNPLAAKLDQQLHDDRVLADRRNRARVSLGRREKD